MPQTAAMSVCSSPGALTCLCREQERREERQRMRADAGGALDPMDDEGSFDDGDPYTTNLYIGKPRSTHMCLLIFSSVQGCCAV